MNGYPEWTPASETPKKDCNCIVTSRGSDPDDDGLYVHDAHYLVGGGWYLEGGSERDNITKDVLAWMPLPSAYKPPKFGWRDAKTDPPTKAGEYMVWWKFTPAAQPRKAFAKFQRGVWELNADVLWWSHIEPTPEAHNET